MKPSEIRKSFDDQDESESHPRDISELPKAITSLHIRSIALTGIFLLLVLYSLHLASAFFIPVVLAVLLSFLFASTIRSLQQFWVPPLLGAVLVVGSLVGAAGFGIYQLALPARDWMGKLPEAARQITHQIEHDISTYLFSITVVNALFGLSVAIAMYFLGMPNPLLWGAMAGLLHFIPFLGGVIGISVVTIVAAVTLDGIGTILLVPTSYFSLNILWEYFVLPLVMGRRLMLNPVVVFVWLIFWGWLWSVPGALMAVPLLAIVKIVCDHVEPLAPLAEFIER